MIIIKKFYTCRYDIVFKEVFSKETNKDILIALLESILKIKIEKIRYLNNEKNVGNLYIKRKHFDLHIKTEFENIQIELNNYINDYTRPRGVAYLCNTYSKETLKGEEYNFDTKYIQINLTYGLSRKKSKYYDDKDMRIYSIQDSNNKEYVNNFYIYEINMDYFLNIWYTKSNKEIDKFKYLIMLDLKEEELKNLSQNDKVVEKYMDEVEKINEDPEFYEYMSAEEDDRKIENSLRRQWKTEGLEEGIKEGIKEGIREGKEQGKIENAVKLVKDGFDIDKISLSLNIDKEIIEKELNKK